MHEYHSWIDHFLPEMWTEFEDFLHKGRADVSGFSS